MKQVTSYGEEVHWQPAELRSSAAGVLVAAFIAVLNAVRLARG